ncbi:MAG TPA: hypothetical protein VF035_02495 [Longimicrobiales bacterium]
MMRAAGGLLIIGSLIPVYRLLETPATGLAGQATGALASAAASTIWGGTMLALAAGILGSRIAGARARDAVQTVRQLLLQPAGSVFAAACAVVSLVAAVCVARFVFGFDPVLVDATAQLIHARHVADGALAAPPDTIGFFRIQQTVPVPGGWVSQYPPGHVLLLAAGIAAGMPWIVGPIMLALAIYFTARAADIMLPGQAAPRAGVVVSALSPFMLLHAGSYMSHTTAAAFIGIALYCFARATRPAVTGAVSASPVWLCAAGCATGIVFAVRPLTGLVTGLVLTAAVLLHPARMRAWRGAAATALGAAPAAAAVMIYNARLFGSPFRFGYDVALGPDAGLGFGVDPWGNTYGVREAVAYTSAELTSLAFHLFESPFPWVAVVGAFFLFRTQSWSEKVLAGVMLAPLCAGLLYWHHGLFMGPRMLNEYGIVWCVMIAVAAERLIAGMPASLDGPFHHYSARAFAASAGFCALLLSLFLAPQQLRAQVQQPIDDGIFDFVAAGSTVFVHSTWTDRAAMRLAARGWRLDEVEAALRQNSTCAVQRVIDGDAPRSSLSLAPRATNLPGRVQLPGGSAFRVEGREQWTPACARQVAADTAGVVDPAAYMWRRVVADRRITVARDLGPELNNILMAESPAAAFALVRGADGSAVLVPYDEAMEKLWATRQP